MNPLKHVALGAVLILVGLCASTSALAETTAPVALEPAEQDTFSLRWVRRLGTEECVSRSELAAMLQDLLGPVLRSRGEADLSVEGFVSLSVVAHWRAVIRVTDREHRIVGEREVTSRAADCRALTRPILLVLAVLIDPEATERRLAPAVAKRLELDESLSAPDPFDTPDLAVAQLAPDPYPRTAPAFTRRDRSATPTKSDAASYGHARLHAAFAFGSGHVPGFDIGARAGLGFSLGGRFHASLDVWAWQANGVALGGSHQPKDEVVFSATQASAQLCYPLTNGPFELSGCAGVMGGIRSANADAVYFSLNPARAYYGPLLALEAAWALDRLWFLSAMASASLDVTQYSFQVTQLDGSNRDLFVPDRLTTGFSIGLGVRL